MTAGKGSILVVDDDVESLRLMIGILEKEGYRVRACDSGRLALRAVAAEPPELILLDVRMPGLDGLELCRQLKASPGSREIPLMFISASVEFEERVQALALGAVDFVSKPFRSAELLARVRNHLELGRLRAQLELQVGKRTAELREALEHLRESEERFRTMADTAPVLIWIAGPDQLRTFFNKGWLGFRGRTMEQELRNGWLDGLHPDDRERYLSSYASAFQERRPFEIEYRLLRADGEYRWMLSREVPRFAHGGVLEGYVGSCVDVTEAWRTQEAAFDRQRVESLRVLTGGLAHDFKNLLASILAQAELAEMTLAEGLPPIEEVAGIKAIALGASGIVGQMMIYSGREQENLEACDVTRLVEQMVELLRASIPKRVRLKTDLRNGLPAVWGNSTRIREIAMNLVLNASEAIGEAGGEVHISTARVTGGVELAPDSGTSLPEGDYVRLRVSDTGCGMTEELRARVFDPFFTTKSGGHGLGLAVIHGIAHSHGGAVHVISAPGHGSTFEVLLPCMRASAGETPTDAPEGFARGETAS
jgi:PAS domain S-box-containing protein